MNFDYLKNVIKTIRSIRAMVKMNPKVKPRVLMHHRNWNPIQEQLVEDNFRVVETLCNIQTPEYKREVPSSLVKGFMSLYINNNLYVYVEVAPHIDIEKEVRLGLAWVLII